MKIPGLSKRFSHTTIAAGTVLLVTLLQGVASAQTYQLCTLTDGTATGFFGGVTIAGSYTVGANPDNSNITVSGYYFGGNYGYTFTGPLDGPGYTQGSEIPGALCVLEGCAPGSSLPPGYANFSLYDQGNGNATLSFEDTGELFGGYGTLSCSTVTPPPPPTCSLDDSTRRKARADGANRSITFTCGCNVLIDVTLIGNGTQQIYGTATPQGMALDAAATKCSYIAFNWQQQVTNLPCPSPFKSSNPMPGNACGNSTPTPGALTAPPAFNDPPNGGYVGTWAGYNPYPFYYTYDDVHTPNRAATLNPTQIVVNNSNTALKFRDIPNDYCLPTGLTFLPFGITLGLTTNLQNGNSQYCGGNWAPQNSSVNFQSMFVGMKDFQTADPLGVWTWTDTYNGGTGLQAGSISIGPLLPPSLSGGGVPIPGTGYGGLTITSINGVAVPPIVPPTQVSVTGSGLGYSHATKTFTGTVTITNISGTTLTTPTSFQLVLNSLTPGVTLVNSAGTFNQGPYITVPALVSLLPAQSVTVAVQFSNPSNAIITYTPEFYAGSFQ